MADEATATTEAADTSGTLLTGETVTDGAEKQPDQGEGEKQPDQGEGEKTVEAPTKAEGEADSGDDAADKGAPDEGYADFTVAEGVTLAEDALASFKEQAKADNLSQEAAQKYVDLAQSIVKQSADDFSNQIIATRESWLASTKADKEIGGDKLDASTAAARRAVDTYGSPELKALLEETTLGNHPEIVRVFAKIGATLAEDKIDGGHAGEPPRSLAERLYPTKTE